MKVIPETRRTRWRLFPKHVVPDEGYSRNASCALNLISTTFLLCNEGIIIWTLIYIGWFHWIQSFSFSSCIFNYILKIYFLHKNSKKRCHVLKCYYIFYRIQLWLTQTNDFILRRTKLRHDTEEVWPLCELFIVFSDPTLTYEWFLDTV